jgi:hypothetical protein
LQFRQKNSICIVLDEVNICVEIITKKIYFQIEIIYTQKNLFDKFYSRGIAELANGSVVHPRDPGSNLCINTKYILILFVSQLNSNL